MKKIVLISFWLIALTVNAQQEILPKVCEGKVIRYANFNSAFVDARNVDVWLPANYNKNKNYAVLYMHDGQMLFDSTQTWNKQEWGVDETITQLIKEHKIKDCIVVGIWNSGKNRHIDYFPQKPFEALTKEEQDSMYAANRLHGNSVFSGKVQSDNYLKFLVNELKPFIDKNFSINKTPAGTFIAGSSMGGLISIYALCEYPNVFGGAACLSTHWPGIFKADNPFPKAMQAYLKVKLPVAKNHKIYFDYGTETLDAMYEPFQLQVDSIMISKGYSFKNNDWKMQKFEGENHSEAAWRKRLHIPILFLLKK
ncbi:MAG: alpha/beta hydrolase [Candidatus Methylacidiphilales bacterium]